MSDDVSSSLRFAFLACNRVARLFRRDPSFIYRCENVGQYLSESGHSVVLCHLRDAPPPNAVDVVVLHRPRASLRLMCLLWRYRRAGVHVVADVDDLVFNERLARFSPAVLNARKPFMVVWSVFRLHRLALSWVAHVVVSTEPLQRQLAVVLPDKMVSCVANAVHWCWRKRAVLQVTEGALGEEPVLAPLSRPSCQQKVIAYLPGTRSHDRDFALIAAQLARFLRDYPDTVLRVTGPVEFVLDVPPGQVIRQERVTFEAYPECFFGVWVNLAPLENTPFNQCKSALKAIEAGFMGVPTVCSPNPDMARFAAAGTLTVADDGWYEALVHLRQPDVYAALTENLREKVVALAGVEAHAQTLLAQLKNHV